MTPLRQQPRGTSEPPRDNRDTTNTHHRDTTETTIETPPRHRPGRQPGTLRRPSAFRVNNPKLSLLGKYNTTQHNTTQHSTAQHSTAQHNTTQHNTITLRKRAILILKQSIWVYCAPCAVQPLVVTCAECRDQIHRCASDEDSNSAPAPYCASFMSAFVPTLTVTTPNVATLFGKKETKNNKG